MSGRKTSRGRVKLRDLVGDRPFHSIYAINQLEPEIRERVYSLLIPERIFREFGIDRETLTNREGKRVVRVKAPPQANFVVVEVRENPEDRDCILYLEVEDTPLYKVQINFLIVNDPSSPRFDTDRDEEGRRTKFGTARRNIPEEIKAMRAGLAPGQVRRGLRLLPQFFAMALEFFSSMGQDMVVAEPLAYHDAIIFENYGFDYIRGKKLMERIHSDFQPGGKLSQALDGSSPFRRPGMEKTVRGRSWALHDGILGEPWGGTEMYRSLERAASVCTFPGWVY